MGVCSSAAFSNASPPGLPLNKSSIETKDLELEGKRVLMRVDFDVPVKDGVVTNSERIAAVIPTIKYALGANAKAVILMSHLGNPCGSPNPEYSLLPCVAELNALLDMDVTFVEDCVSDESEIVCKKPPKGSVILLENLCFHPEEEGESGVDTDGGKVKIDKDDQEDFRARLMGHGDVYVNEAFQLADRAHTSLTGSKHHRRVAGLLFNRELQFLAKAVNHPGKPFLAILGGATMAHKVPLIESMLDRAQDIIITGAMAFTFLKVLDNVKIGDSLYDVKGAEAVERLMGRAAAKKVKIHLPTDWVTGDALAEDAQVGVGDVVSGIPAGYMGLDTGPVSVANFRNTIRRAQLILWYGPPGACEFHNFSKATTAMMDTVIATTEKGCVSILAGRSMGECAAKHHNTSQVSHVSTGGAAALHLLEAKALPAIFALNDAEVLVKKK